MNVDTALPFEEYIKRAQKDSPQGYPEAPQFPKAERAAPGSGAKWDGGKPMFDLLELDCANATLGIVQVMTWAVDVKRYEPGSWLTVPEAIRRYGAALRRHQNAKARGERYDKESGLLHDFHIATNAVFIAELEARVEIAAGRMTFQYNATLPAQA